MKPPTRLFLAHIEEKRTTTDYTTLLYTIENMRSLSTGLPLFTSDNWDAIKDAITATYSYRFQPSYQGRGRPPNPITIPFTDLKYAQVCKKRENGRVVEVIQRVVYASVDEILSLLDTNDQ